MTFTPSPIRLADAQAGRVAYAGVTAGVSCSHRAPALLGLAAFALGLPAQASADEPDCDDAHDTYDDRGATATKRSAHARCCDHDSSAGARAGDIRADRSGRRNGPEAGPQAGAGGPQVEAQHAQNATPGGSSASGKTGAHCQAAGKGHSGRRRRAAADDRGHVRVGPARESSRAVSLGAHPVTAAYARRIDRGGAGFFVESFQIPPFLLPIYQAAGTAYGIPWQVLAAINEVETDYGRDLSVSSAGAEGWMQFLPSTWAQYGVDANGDGFKDPYNPADAIFAAARYLRAAGGDANVRAAVYSYNHSQAYVDSVMLRAQLLGGTPPELLGAVTGLTEARFPVHAVFALRRRLRDDPRSWIEPGESDRRHDDLLPGGGSGDRRARRRNRADRRLALARAVRVAARRLWQHLCVRAARQRGLAVSGA